MFLKKFTGKIGFENLTLQAVIGIHDEERVSLQPLIIDVEVVADIERATENDSIEEAIDYQKLSFLAETIVAKKFFLIETLARELLKAVLEQFPVISARVRVKKPKALENGAIAYVEVENERG